MQALAVNLCQCPLLTASIREIWMSFSLDISLFSENK